MQRPDADVWEDIRIAYEQKDPPEPIKQIATRFGVAAADINAKARAAGWASRLKGADLLRHLNAARALADAQRPWGDIRTAYETSIESVVEIAKRFEVSGRQISHRAHRDGWERRPQGAEALAIGRAKRLVGLKTAGEIVPKSAIGSGGTQVHRRNIVARLYDVTDAKLRAIETRLAASTRTTSADAERESRELANILKIFEKLGDLSHALARPATKPGDGKPGTIAADAAAAIAANADRFRLDLAERIEKLKQRQRDVAAARNPEAG